MKIDKKTIAIVLFDTVWICTLTIALGYFLPNIQSWPLFFVSIFMTVYDEKKPLKDIIIQAIAGIVVSYVCYCSIIYIPWKYYEITHWIPVGISIALVLFGCVITPNIFSIVSFAYFTIMFVDIGCFENLGGILAMVVIGGVLHVPVMSFAKKIISRFL